MPHFLVAILASLAAFWLAVRREFETASRAGDASIPPEVAPIPPTPPLSKPDSRPRVGASGSWMVSSGGATGRWNPPAKAKPYLALFDRATAAYGLPAGLLARVADEESDFNPNAINPDSHASGLMQWMPWIAAKVGFDPFDPVVAVDQSGQEFKRLFRRFGDWRLALAAYNFGQTNLAAALANPDEARAKYTSGEIIPRATVKYVNAIAGDIGL